MKIFFFVISLIVVASLLAFGVDVIHYKLFIRRMAKKYTYQEINEKIANDLEEIKSTKYKGTMLESILDHKELWEQIKEYKRTHF